MGNETPSPSRTEELKRQAFGFDEHPLTHFRNLSAAEIEAHPGIGPKFRERIQAALAELSELTGEDYHTPKPPPPVVADGVAEPVAPGTAGPTVLLLVLVLVAIIVAAVMFGRTGRMTEQQQAEFEQAKETAVTAGQVLGVIGAAAGREAMAHATNAYQFAHEGEFGSAREHLAYAGAALKTMQNAASSAAPGIDPDRLNAAQSAVMAASDSLRLDQPQTQEQVLAAVRRAVVAVGALQPEEVKN